MSRTDPRSDFFGISEDFSSELVLPSTEVISPDFRSTPTIDHGRGFGSGFGLAASPIDDPLVSFDSGDEDKAGDGENFEARSPTIDPPVDPGFESVAESD